MYLKGIDWIRNVEQQMNSAIALTTNTCAQRYGGAQGL